MVGGEIVDGHDLAAERLQPVLDGLKEHVCAVDQRAVRVGNDESVINLQGIDHVGGQGVITPREPPRGRPEEDGDLDDVGIGDPELGLERPADPVDLGPAIARYRAALALGLGGHDVAAGLVFGRSDLDAGLAVFHQEGDFVAEGESLVSLKETSSLVFVLDLPYEWNRNIHKKSRMGTSIELQS